MRRHNCARAKIMKYTNERLSGSPKPITGARGSGASSPSYLGTLGKITYMHPDRDEFAAADIRSCGR
ncbi:hypothetical protein VP1G_10561 [Cytospora mali]|uniref:Uncharacterized protein n=1 Tax=Cytospora mali TaxID=578113 RepID=A0A194UPT3_CYTMA|nr:hypothetical protein VP1G_10561 [Valsa mali var. pyri (nom. inval.)]